MKTIIATLAAITALGACAFAQDTAAPAEVNDKPKQPGVERHTIDVPGPVDTPDRDTVLKAIEAFRRDPVQAKERGMGALILKFAEDSKDVQLEIGPKVVPWMDDKSDTKYGPLLLVAFVAGDVRAQLEAHSKKDDPMAGALQVLDTYAILRKADPTIHFGSVEQWIALQKQGKLRSFLEPQAQ